MNARKIGTFLPASVRRFVKSLLGLENKVLNEYRAERQLIGSSGYFDAEFYTRCNRDVLRSGVSPLDHYLLHGWREGRRPSGVLGVQTYKHASPELKAALSAFGANEDSKEILGRHLPDREIAIELMRGQAFASRFDFKLDSDGAGRRISEAVSFLASQKPAIVRGGQEFPDASIIIPIYGQTHLALNCLDSLANHLSKYTAEIIVIDDASPDHLETQMLQNIPWIRYVRRNENGGFLDTCNDAAEHATGRILCLLNSDTRVVDYWLDETIDTFEIFPNAGLVGSMLINEDGTLQEAGGIFWKDGSAWNYGRGHDPSDPRYCFARRADYCSAAAIAVPKIVWESVRGFDTEFRPAYAEDADLAFRIRQNNRETWYQPLSKVIHYEGKTHGRDVTKGIKSYQVTNMLKFKSRWQDVLASHGIDGQLPAEEANRNAKKRLLVIDSLTPTPDQDSGSFITEKMLRAYQELGYEITFVPQNSYAWVEQYSSSLQRIGIECVYTPFQHNIYDVIKLHANFDAVLVYRYSVLDQVYDLIREHLPLARIIFHNVDLHFVREEREASLRQSRAERIAAKMTETLELSMIAKADCNIVHTPVEAALIREQLPIDNIIEFPYISDVHENGNSFEERHDIMFLGGFAHRPNVDAVLEFHQNVWPKVREKLPSKARFLVVGASVPERIAALANERVIVTGFVPALEPWFNCSRVFVAPLRYGAGIKGKLIQSLSFGVPSVASQVAAEGIGLTSGVDAIVTDDPQDFANAIVDVYHNKEKWTSIRSAGFNLVRSQYSWTKCLELCERALDVADITWLRREDHRRRLKLENILKEDGRLEKRS